MVKVDDVIREAFIDQRVIPMATVNHEGVPNVIYVGMWWWRDDGTLCVINNYLRKTLENLRDNGWASFVCYGKKGSYQIKTRCKEITEGPVFKKGQKIATERGDHFPGRSVIACRVVEIYQAKGGKGAGYRLS